MNKAPPITHKSERKNTKLTFDVFLAADMARNTIVAAINAVAAYRGMYANLSTGCKMASPQILVSIIVTQE